jgi:8-oxo-dGTP pyrophosphatase MutT (NUDIX family)
MPYVGSYIWEIRQKIGHDLLIIPAVEVVAARDDGALMMVYNKDFDQWTFPGGYAEANQTSEVAATRELLEEAGLETATDDLVPFAYKSGHEAHYKNGDVTQPFTQVYLTRNWRDGGDNLDEVEISERRWFSLDEISQMSLQDGVNKVITAYSAFLATGKYQIINGDIKTTEDNP